MSLRSKIKKGSQILHSVLVPPRPEDLSGLIFAITNLCNSRCTLCNIWQTYKKNPEKYEEELTCDEIRELLGKSNLLKQIKVLGIAGGEPFLKKDFVEIILFFHDVNPSLWLFIPSNGQSPDLIQEKLTLVGRYRTKKGITSPLIVGFSLDGTEETHDKMRGVKRSYRRVLESVELVKKIECVTHVGVSFTFTPENYKEFSAVNDLAKRLDVSCGFQFAQLSNHYYGNAEKKFCWTKDQLDEVRDIFLQTGYLEKKSEQALPYSLVDSNWIFLEHVLQYQLKPRRNFNCFSGTHSCYMDPYGNVFPCIILDKSFGNIRERNFDSLWTSSCANNVRNSISRRECHCCSFCDIPNSLAKNWRIIPWNLKKMIFSDR